MNKEFILKIQKSKIRNFITQIITSLNKTTALSQDNESIK